MATVRTLVVALLCVHGGECAKKRKSRTDDAPAPSAPASAPNATTAPGQASVVAMTFSTSITPYHETAGVPVTNAERHVVCQMIVNSIHAEAQMRFADGQITFMVCRVEEGESEKNAHMQLTYGVRVVMENTTEARTRMSAKEKAWLKSVIAIVSNESIRVCHKTVAEANKTYVQGYCNKDARLAHSVGFDIGLTPEELERADAVYLAKAATFHASASKIHKAPHKNSTEISLKANNLFVLTAWFVAQHELEPLHAVLSLALVIAYAISTGKYRLDDSLVTGHTGSTLDPNRTQVRPPRKRTHGARASHYSVPRIKV